MKKFHKFMPKFIVVMLIATVFLSACSKSSNEPSATNSGTDTNTPVETTTPVEPVTIEFWHTYSEDADKGTGENPFFMKEIIPAFEKAHPNIKIKATKMPNENLDQQVLTAAAGGSAPDVMRMDLTWVANFAKLKALQPLDSFPGFDQIKGEVFEGPLSSNLYNSEYYGLPLNTNTKVGIYNKEILTEGGATEPPKTIDELVQLAKNLKAKGKFGITIGGTSTWDFLPWFWTLGGKVTNDEFTKASGFLNSPESIKAMETVVGWNDEGLLAPTITGGQPSTWDGLRDQDGGEKAKYMMINDGPWFFSIFGDAVKDKMIPAVMPAGPDGKSHSVVGGEDIVMFKGAKHPEEAWEFIQFMLSEEIQVKLASAGLIPTNKNAAQNPELSTNAYYLTSYVQELETANTRTPSANWNKISDRLGLAFDLIIKKQASAKDELDKAAAEVDALLAE